MQHRVFVAVAYEQVLSGREPTIIVEASAADEKRLSAGPAAQAGGFEVEENERHVRWRAATDERGLVDGRLEPGRQFTNRRPAATRRWWRMAFHDEAAVTPFAAEEGFGVIERPAKAGRYSRWRRRRCCSVRL